MSNKNEITISNTSYNIEEDWLQLAKENFNMENVNLLKTGFFGYFNEIASNEIKNNVYHRNVLYDEHFLNTASIPKSIYNFAKMLNYDIDMAIPSTMSINLSLSKSKLINSSKLQKVNKNDITDSDAVYSFMIDTDVDFTVRNQTFRLPYPVQILFTYSNVDKDYSVTARYVYDDEKAFPYFKESNPYIKVWEANYNGERYIFLKLDIYQLERLESEILITSEDVSDNLFNTVEFTNQLAYFEVYYTYDGKTEQLNTYFNNTYTPTDEKFCYYNLVSSNKLEISFSSLPNCFRPAYNSKLTFVCYVTNGAKGNFDYIKDITINFNNEDELNSIPMLITPITESSGGCDVPSLVTTKSNLIKKYLTRDNIITDFDLDNFFNSINLREKINDSKIKFIKKRDDVIKRLYNAFLLLRDSNKMVIPTKTLPNLYLSESIIKDMQYSIPEEAVIVYDLTTEEFKCIYHKLEIKRYLNNDNFLVYSIPYFLKIDQKPILSSVYYDTFIDQDVSFNYKYLNASIPFKFIISNFNIKRESLSGQVYSLQLTLNTNLTETTNLSDVLKIRGILKSTSGETYGYFEFNKSSDNDLIYEASLCTTKYNSIQEDRLNLYNSIYSINTSPILDNDGNTSVVNCLVSNEVNLEIQVLYKSNYSTTKMFEANKMPDMNDFASACVFTNGETIKLFKNLSNVMESTVTPAGTGLNISSVPLIEYNYFTNNMRTVYNLLDTYNEVLSENLESLENNTNVDIKFFNTHGKSDWYCKSITQSASTGKYSYENIDRVDLTLDLNIYLNKNITDEDDTAIKKYISDFIEASNDELVFPISNLIRQLEINFEIIKFIEWNTINNFDIQKVASRFKNITELSKNELKNYVPEYLNLRKKVSSITNEEDGTTEKVYKYEITINYI